MSKKPPADELKVFCNTLRAKHGVEWREGILHDKRVEFFRGKDLQRYYQKHPSNFEKWVGGPGKPEERRSLQPQARGSMRMPLLPLAAGKPEEECLSAFVELLMRRRLVQRVDRRYQNPKPGKLKRVKWPRKLVDVLDVNLQTFSEDGFYAWTYDRPASPYLLLYSALIVLVVVGCCLFPLAPYRIKLVVVYLSMGLLSLILGTIVGRLVVMGLTWMTLGRGFWILPNVLSEELGFFDAFKPLYSWDEASPNTSLNIALRAALAALTAASIYALFAYTPDAGSIGAGAVNARDSILDMLNLHDPAQLKISGNATDGGQNKTGRAHRKGMKMPGSLNLEL